jgi:hypothetical protein
MLSIPIVSSFDGSGIEKAKKEFAQLDGAAAKTKFAFKKALLPATAAVAGLGAALFDATKGAIEDAAAQDLLANNLRRTTGATDAQIKANEDWISTQGKLLGITDDELRPVLSKFAKATGDVTKAQQYANQAMDIAAATGKPLASVTDSIVKAMGGNLTALGKLAPEYRQMIKDGADFETIMSLIADTTGGSATKAANTAAGKFKTLKNSLNETKESIGAALLPIIEKALPVLVAMGNWASENTAAFLIIAGVIGGIAAAVVLVNAAITAWTAITTAATAVQAAFNAVLALNPITLTVIAIGLLIAALVVAYKKFEGFRNLVDGVFKFLKSAVGLWVDGVKLYFGTVYTIFKTLFNGIASLWNNTVGKLSFKFPSFVPGLAGKGFDVPNIPMLAEGGIVNKATLAVIGESGPEAVVPLSRAGEFGMGGGNNVTINVNGGDPNAVVSALRTYMRQNGSVPIRVSNIF